MTLSHEFNLVTTGHETVMAKVTFFCSTRECSEKAIFTEEFEYQGSLSETGPISSHVSPEQHSNATVDHYALLEFEKPIICPPQSKIIGSRLDNDAFRNKCRIAFHGYLVEDFTKKDYESSILPQIRIFKLKRREGLVERVRGITTLASYCYFGVTQIHDNKTVIGRSLFKKETKIELFVNMKVKLSTGMQKFVKVVDVTS